MWLSVGVLVIFSSVGFLRLLRFIFVPSLVMVLGWPPLLWILPRLVVFFFGTASLIFFPTSCFTRFLKNDRPRLPPWLLPTVTFFFFKTAKFRCTFLRSLCLSIVGCSFLTVFPLGCFAILHRSFLNWKRRIWFFFLGAVRFSSGQR